MTRALAIVLASVSALLLAVAAALCAIEPGERE